MPVILLRYLTLTMSISAVDASSEVVLGVGCCEMGPPPFYYSRFLPGPVLTAPRLQ